jgi:hypothetical protein
MRKNKDHLESEIEISSANSDNIIENTKYNKKLALQCVILKRIINPELIGTGENIDSNETLDDKQ